MERVKAAINLKEGVIELEGPQEFVEKYLEKYESRIKEGKTFSSSSDKEDKTNIRKAGSKRQKTRGSKGTASCMGRIRTLIDEDFFKEPKNSKEVVEWLKDQKGITHTSGQVSAALNQLIKSNTLRRFKEGKIFKYCNL